MARGPVLAVCLPAAAMAGAPQPSARALADGPGACLPPRATRNLLEAQHWGRDAMDQARKIGLPLIDFSKEWTISSGCSGIMTFELGARMAVHAYNTHSSRGAEAGAPAHSVKCLWACEKSAKCRREMKDMPVEHQPQAIFCNFDDFLPPATRSKLQRLDRGAPDYPQRKDCFGFTLSCPHSASPKPRGGDQACGG